MAAEALPLLDGTSAPSLRRRIALLVSGAAALSLVAVCASFAQLHPAARPRELLTMPPRYNGEGTPGVVEGKRHFPESVVRQMNPAVDPCDDFYQYACGGFEKHMHIPEDLGGFARSWDGGSDKIYKEMKKVLEKDQGKAGDWFRSCMLVDHVNKLGAEPLQPYIAQVEAVKTYEDMWALLSQFQFWDVPAFFDWWVGADNLEPELMNFYLGTGGLILPDQSYYTDDTEEMQSHRKAYRTFIVEQLTLSGRTPAQAEDDADQCIEIETELAVYQKLEPYVSLKQSFKHISQQELIDAYPNLNFTMLISRLGIEEVGQTRKNIVVKAPGFYTKLSSFFAKRSPESLIPYLRWHLVYNLSPLLSQDFLDATLKVDANLMGISKQPERWHKCVAATKSALPSVADKLFIDNFFSENDRQIALTMLDYIRGAFKKDLENVAWMSEEARNAALEKLHNIFFECGHPMVWQDDDVAVSPTSYFDNSLAACEAKKKEKLARLFHPRDRRRWSMSVMSVNSYYDNAVNGLFITAGMLQKPFFSADYEMERNFGGVGVIMGHELTHGFDNTGRKYDQQSRLKDWWDKETVAEFDSRGHCIAELFSTFKMLGLHVKGNATLGENIADFGGIKSAYNGWLSWYTEDHCKGISEQEMPMTYKLCHRSAQPSLNKRQLFWLSYGQNWCDKERAQSMKMSLLTDEHSPDHFRVNGPLSQNDDFARDFHCPVGSKMNPEKKCKLW